MFRTRTAASGGKDLPRQAEQQDPTANAAAFQAGLVQNGHVEVPGGFFDTGKSDVKPKSEPALKEVVKLLPDKLNLKVWVVGHTDNTGSEKTHVNLSQARAAAVVKVLSEKMGVAASAARRRSVRVDRGEHDRCRPGEDSPRRTRQARSVAEGPAELDRQELRLRGECQVVGAEIEVFPAPIPDDEQVVARPESPPQPQVVPDVL